jgi:glycosyltransferase involved in cell wall biosynthesis
MLNITAIICTRNEGVYLKTLIPYLEGESIKVIIIDNESDDGTLDQFNRNTWSNISSTHQLKYDGYFDLQAQLEKKHELTQSLKTDWVIHQDADEILHNRDAWGGLRAAIEAADRDGFNALNFEEFVMLPENVETDDILSNNRLMYYFAPRPVRLMRAWKNNISLSNVNKGGHGLDGPSVKCSPEHHILKHFIVRNQNHAWTKYIGRTFNETEVKRGWHGNRLNFTRDNLRIPVQHPKLVRLDTPQSMPLTWPERQTRHFWEWKK